MSDEHRPAGSALEEPGQQPGGAGVPVHGLQYAVPARLAPAADLGPGALGLDQAAAPGEVQLLDVDADVAGEVGDADEERAAPATAHATVGALRRGTVAKGVSDRPLAPAAPQHGPGVQDGSRPSRASNRSPGGASSGTAIRRRNTEPAAPRPSSGTRGATRSAGGGEFGGGLPRGADRHRDVPGVRHVVEQVKADRHPSGASEALAHLRQHEPPLQHFVFRERRGDLAHRRLIRSGRVITEVAVASCGPRLCRARPWLRCPRGPGRAQGSGEDTGLGQRRPPPSSLRPPAARSALPGGRTSLRRAADPWGVVGLDGERGLCAAVGPPVGRAGGTARPRPGGSTRAGPMVGPPRGLEDHRRHSIALDSDT